tara:strand:- start:516 stop:1157 length:642 start_codon:yes stop_codon:yes gene_type:complete
MKIKKRKIKDLIRAKYNPRKLTKVKEQDLNDSLTKFGMVDPVIINMNDKRKNIIIGGHQRVKVWESLGNKEVDCVELNITEDEEKELNIRLNKNTGDWDYNILNEYFDPQDLVEYGFEVNEVYRTIEDSQEDDDINIDIPIQQSLQVIPKLEYILITANKDSQDWEELKSIMNLKRVRSGGARIGSTSDWVGTERVFNLSEFKKRINDYSNTK